MTMTTLAGPPVAMCNRCGRTTWAHASIGSDDRMDHIAGGRCGGRFIATDRAGAITVKTDALRAEMPRIIQQRNRVHDPSVG